MTRAIGLDIGGTHVKAVLVNTTGQVLAHHQLETGDAGNAWHTHTRAVVNHFERDHGPIDTIGVCSPGIARPDGRGISWMTGRMSGVVGFDFTDHLSRRTPVPVLNDGHAALLGEVWLGAGRGLQDVIMLTLGTGVGGAILSRGRLLKGHTGRAGHLGHITVDASGPRDICNTPGSIEHFIGNYSLPHRTGGAYTSTADLVRDATSGDVNAQRIWQDSVHKLAAMIASTINMLDPQRLIIGGGIANAGPALFVPLAAALDEFEWRPTGQKVEIAPAELGDRAGAIGAAWNAINGGTL